MAADIARAQGVFKLALKFTEAKVSDGFAYPIEDALAEMDGKCRDLCRYDVQGFQNRVVLMFLCAIHQAHTFEVVLLVQRKPFSTSHSG